MPNGEINWACPCLGNMVVGPCSIEFRESLSCFHKSTAEPKGSDCLEQFKEMNECMARYPGLYKKNDDDDEEKLNNLEKQNAINSSKDADDSNSAIQETSKIANV